MGPAAHFPIKKAVKSPLPVSMGVLLGLRCGLLCILLVRFLEEAVEEDEEGEVAEQRELKGVAFRAKAGTLGRKCECVILERLGSLLSLSLLPVME